MPKRKTRSKLKGRSNWKKLIGLTGGIGSGKSTVLNFFKAKKALTLDADKIVHQVLKKKETLARIKKTFGSEVLTRAGRLNRKKMAGVIFQSVAKRRALEKLLHPAVRAEMSRKLLSRKGQVAVCDVPLLFEKKWEPTFDAVVVVWASQAVREKRLQKRGFSLRETRARMKAQMPLSKKVAKADYVIRNNGSLAQTKKQTNLIWQKIVNQIRP